MSFFGKIFSAVSRGLKSFYLYLYHFFMRRGWTLKSVLVLPLLLVLVSPPFVIALPFLFVISIFVPTIVDVGVYSDGYREGVLTSWSANNFNIAGVTEGTIQLGNSGKTWEFSSNTPKMKQYAHLQGMPVLVHYHQVMLQLFKWSGKTDYRVEDMVAIDQSKIPEACGRAATGGIHDGFHTGRIVKASLKGNIIKSYEIEMQLGNGVSNEPSYPLSISDKATFDCAVAFMASGHQTNVYYSHGFFRNVFAHATNEIVYGIKPVETLH